MRIVILMDWLLRSPSKFVIVPIPFTYGAGAILPFVDEKKVF
jgi:hypothetical protein